MKMAQEQLLTLISPVFYSSAFLKKNITEFTKNRSTLHQLEADNSRLLLENRELQAENSVLHAAVDENNQLRKALTYYQESAFQLVPATIIARDNSPWWNSFKIDRGSRDGITPDMAVITENGLVGKTSVVTPGISTIMLITDENCNVSWQLIKAITRHNPGDQLYQIKTHSGREVTVSDSHSLLIWNGSKFDRIKPEDVNIGDFVPVSCELIKPNPNSKLEQTNYDNFEFDKLIKKGFLF
jgi:cell shape-determining protein MreC